MLSGLSPQNWPWMKALVQLLEKTEELLDIDLQGNRE